MVFSCVMREEDISQVTKIYINFPLYYTPGITNFEDDLYCKINKVRI